MRIAFYISQLKSKGGAERALIGLANKLAEYHEVNIVVESGNADSVAYPLSEQVSLHSLESKIKQTVFQKIEALKAIWEVMDSIIPDVIISFLAMSNIRLLASGIQKRYPVIVCERNDPQSDPDSKIKRTIRDLLYRKADKVIGQTEEVKGYFERKGCKSVCAIPNYVNAIPLTKENRSKTFVSVGRLTSQKNHKWLIDCFAKSGIYAEGYNLAIYGNGELRDELLTYINECGLSNYVAIHNAIPNIIETINRCYCFVLSSKYEGMPNALMEAMSEGMPCISTDCPCGGPRSLIKTGWNGLLVELGNQDAMVEAIITIAHDERYATYLGSNALKIRETNSIDAISKRWIQEICESIKK